MATLKAKDQKIERHKAHEKNGCEIMQVERDTEVNEYARRRGARVVNGEVVCDLPLEFAEQYTVQQQFEKSNPAGVNRRAGQSCRGTRSRFQIYWCSAIRPGR